MSDEEKPIYKPTIITENFIAEECYDSSRSEHQVFYLRYDKATGKIEELDEIEVNGVIFRPILNDDVTTQQIFLPSWAEEYGTDAELFAETEAFLEKWHEERHPQERKTDVLYVAQTHVYDPLPELAYRRILAAFGFGKSAWIIAMGAICYRGMILAGCDSVASLRATFDFWRGTGIIDEADFSDKEMYGAILKILCIGHSSKHGWYRSQDPDNPSKSRSQRVFGPKLLATRQRWKDAALESRCLTKRGFENLGDIPLFRNIKFLNEAQKFRNKWLLWRFRKWHKFRDVINEKIEDKRIFQSLYGEEDKVNGKRIGSRIKQLLVPMGFLAEQDANLLSMLKKYGVESQEILDSLDEEGEFAAQIKDKIDQLLKLNLRPSPILSNPVSQVSEVSLFPWGSIPPQIPDEWIWDITTKQLKIPLKQIVSPLILIPESSPDYTKTLRWIGKKAAAILRDRLGFTVKRGTEGLAFVHADLHFLEPYLVVLKEQMKQTKLGGDTPKRVDSLDSPDSLGEPTSPLPKLCELCGKNSAAVWLEGVVEGRKLAACRSCVEEMKAGKKDLS